MKIGVYVGSFNPVHIGHIHIVNYLINNNYLDKVIIIPTGNYWDKNDLIDIKHRINMLKFYENDRIMINDNEIKSEKRCNLYSVVEKQSKLLHIDSLKNAENTGIFFIFIYLTEQISSYIISMIFSYTGQILPIPTNIRLP